MINNNINTESDIMIMMVILPCAFVGEGFIHAVRWRSYPSCQVSFPLFFIAIEGTYICS